MEATYKFWKYFMIDICKFVNSFLVWRVANPMSIALGSVITPATTSVTFCPTVTPWIPYYAQVTYCHLFC